MESFTSKFDHEHKLVIAMSRLWRPLLQSLIMNTNWLYNNVKAMGSFTLSVPFKGTISLFTSFKGRLFAQNKIRKKIHLYFKATKYG